MGTALPSILITPVSSDAPIAYTVALSSGATSTSLNPQVSIPGEKVWPIVSAARSK